MELKFYERHPNSEFGKNLSVLPAKFNKFNEVSDSVTIEKLLNFQENHVSNFFVYDENSGIFKFEHKDREYIAKANARLNSKNVSFSAKFIEGLLVEYGISYVGVIRILYEDEHFDIKVPGELSYDPGSKGDDKTWVDLHQVHKLIVFVSILVKAALLGCDTKFIRRLYTVTKPIISNYYKKTELFKWMYVQVKATCMKKKHPPTYAEFLNNRSHKSETVNQYLSNVNLLNEGQIEEVLPPADYFKAISAELENSGIKEKLNTFEESGIKEKLAQNEEFLICFSPDLEEDSVPTILEIFNDLKQLKGKYETEMALAMKKICGLNDDYKKKVDFTTDEKFEAQCPIF